MWARLASRKKMLSMTAVAVSISCVGVVTEAQVSAVERAALIDLYEATGGSSWSNRLGWWDGQRNDYGAVGTECSWYGVYCSDGVVTGLRLLDNELTGNIPATIGDLAHLRGFVVGLDDIQSIPAEIGLLKDLGTLGFESTEISSLPASMSELTNVTVVYGMNAELRAFVDVSSWTSLRDFYLGGNELESFPPGLFSSSLKNLYLMGNLLSGALPHAVLEAPNLDQLDLSHNALYADTPEVQAWADQRDPDWMETQTLAPANPSASAAANGKVLLEWEPAGFGDGYELEASSDGVSGWTIIAVIEGVATSSVEVESAPDTYFRLLTFTESSIWRSALLRSEPTAAFQVLPDFDGDGVPDDRDNCFSISNPDQADADADGVGDACDQCHLDPENDVDEDGFCGNVDNCPHKFNQDQTDTDNDGIGDACEPTLVDFNQDGKVDLLWRNRDTGENAVWYMDGNIKLSGVHLPLLVDQNWELKGAGDFDRDGEPDLVWRNTSNGQNAVWFMTGAKKESGLNLPTLVDQDWDLVSVNDFDQDGDPDLIWRHVVTGQNAVWYMEGLSKVALAYMTTLSETNWELEGTGDFDLDGNVDLVWRHKINGQNAVWYMDGVTKGVGRNTNTLSDLNWKLVGVADLSGDGKPDLIWRNGSNGQNAIWYMDGTTKTAGVYIPTLRDQSWTGSGPK